jgi:hypothetical protein
MTFLDESRINCRHLTPAVLGSLSHARCSICSSGATYRNEDHRKWLHIEANGSGYSVADLLNTRNFVPYVAPSGERVPILPLVIALYHDADPGLLVGQRSQFDLVDFLSDFNFSTAEYDTYFDDDPAAPGNQVLISQFPQLSYTRLSALASQPGWPAHGRGPTSARQAVLVPPRTVVAPPAVNTGFDAEQFVAAALESAQWAVYNVSRQQLGYDFLAKRGTRTRYVEVKSSLGACTASLIAREWHQALFHRASYVLAVIENFTPLGANSVYWVPDPASSCVATQNRSVSYAIPRASWLGAAVDLSTI